MKLLEIYKSILKAAHLLVDDEGFISRFRYGKKEPWLIGEKRAVLGTPEQLSGPGDGTVVFHPLYEYLSRGESQVTAEYRRVMAESLHDRYLALARKLIEIAGSQQMHALLSPEQSEFLSYVPDADATMLDNFDKLCEAMPEGQNQKTFVSIFARRGGKLDDKTHHRVCIVSFPLYKQLVKDGEEREALMAERKAQTKADKDKAKKTDEKDKKIPNETYGVELRGKDRESFIKLFEYMIPDIAVENAYSTPSNSNIAPFMDCIMGSVQKLAGPLNDLVARFENKLEGAEKVLMVEDAWVDAFVNLAAIHVEIQKTPMQAGNEGESVRQAMEAEARAKATPGAPPPVEGAPGAREVASQPAAGDEVAPAGFRLPPKREEPVRHHLPQTHHQPAPYAPPPGQAPYVPPGAPYQPPGGYPPPPQQHGPQGNDWRSMVRSNPALAAAVGAQAVQRGAPHPQSQADVPTWARNDYRPQNQQQYEQHPQQGYYQGQHNAPYKPSF